MMAPIVIFTCRLVASGILPWVCPSLLANLTVWRFLIDYVLVLLFSMPFNLLSIAYYIDLARSLRKCNTGLLVMIVAVSFHMGLATQFSFFNRVF